MDFFKNNEAEDFDPIPIILKHMRLECIGVTPDGLMERISGPYPDDIANFYITKHLKGFSAFISKELPLKLREELKSLSPEKAFSNFELIKKILGGFYPKDGPKQFKSFIFPANIDPLLFPSAVLLDKSHEQLFHDFESDSKFPKHPAFGIIIDGKLICVCESSKENDEAGESWVRTLESYRGKGYAKQATLAWANNLQRVGKTPYYSYKASNLLSSYLAISLELIKVSDEVAY